MIKLCYYIQVHFYNSLFVQVMHSEIITAVHSARKIATTTLTAAATVPECTREPGGTSTATTPISMASIYVARTRQTLTALDGKTGMDCSTPSRKLP